MKRWSLVLLTLTWTGGLQAQEIGHFVVTRPSSMRRNGAFFWRPETSNRMRLDWSTSARPRVYPKRGLAPAAWSVG